MSSCLKVEVNFNLGMLPFTVVVDAAYGHSPHVGAKDFRRVIWLQVASAVFAVVGAAVWPNMHTFAEDTVFTVGGLVLAHLCGAAAFHLRRPLLMAAYVAFSLWLLTYAFVEWWLPYFFHIVSPARDAHVIERLGSASSILPQLRTSVHIVPPTRHLLALPLLLATTIASAVTSVRFPDVGHLAVCVAHWPLAVALHYVMWKDITDPVECIVCDLGFHYGTSTWTEAGCLVVAFTFSVASSLGFGLANILAQVVNDEKDE